MKKIAVFILVIVLLFGAVSCAEGLDLSTLDDKQLIDLSTAVQKEIIKRDLDKKVKVPSGTYIVGEDIPAGDYTVRPTGIALIIEIYKDEVKLGNRTGIFSANQGEIIGKISLKEGDIIEITMGGSIFEKYVGLGF